MGFALVLFLSVIAVVVIWEFSSKHSLVEFPFLISIVFAGWLAPQAIGIYYSPGPFVTESGYVSTTMFATLCFVACVASYKLTKKSTQVFEFKLSRQRLGFCSLVLSVLGGYFFYRVSMLAPEANLMVRGWSGPITIFSFLSRMTTAGLAIAAVLVIRRFAPYLALIIGVDLMFYFHRIVVQGRRAAMVELALIAVFAVWYYQKRAPPRIFVVVGFVLGALLVYSIGDYRKTMVDASLSWTGSGLEQVLKIDFVGNFTRQESKHEMVSAILNIESSKRAGDRDYGLSLWNAFVHSYIPGQLVGYEVKEGLKLDFPDPTRRYFRGYVSVFGATVTGLSDAFRSFGYFGWIKFFVIGMVMKKLFLSANAGSVSSQLVLMILTPAALHVVSHSTHWFFLAFLQVLAFLIPAFLFASRFDHPEVVSPRLQIDKTMPITR